MQLPHGGESHQCILKSDSWSVKYHTEMRRAVWLMQPRNCIATACCCMTRFCLVISLLELAYQLHCQERAMFQVYPAHPQCNFVHMPAMLQYSEHHCLLQVKPARLLLIADEADELWTYHMTPEHVRTATPCKITQREQQMYTLLKSVPGLHSFIQVHAAAYGYSCQSNAASAECGAVGKAAYL